MKRYLLSRNTACLGGLLVVIVVGGLMFAFGEGGPKQALVAPVLWLAHPTRYCQVKQFGGILAARRHR